MVTKMNVPQGFRKALLPHLPFADSEELAADDDLAALGLDSMGVVQLLSDLEETFGLELPDELISEETFATVGSLWNAVGELVQRELLPDE